MNAGRRRSVRGVHATWLSFARRYGWRAYALPVLTVITIAALMRDTSTSPHVASGSDGTGRSVVDGSNTEVASTFGGGNGVQVEGLTGKVAGYRSAATPAPVVIRLGSDATSCATNSYRQLVLVSISRQQLWACAGAKQVNSTPVTTGKLVDDDQTPLGSWRVQAKQRDRYLVGRGYKDYVQYWVPFNGDFGFHDAPWQTIPFGSADWRTDGSHGCVHVPTATMAWLYRWSRVGNTVVTVEN